MQFSTNNYFYPVKASCDLTDYLFEVINNNQLWYQHLAFDFKTLSNEILKQDDFLKWIISNYDVKISVLRIKPNKCYIWHTDKTRQVSINMLLSAFDSSHSVFSKAINFEQDIVFDITELKYEPNTFYVFNTQKIHTVFNFNEPRYTLSIEFINNDNKTRYLDLVTNIKNIYEKRT